MEPMVAEFIIRPWYGWYVLLMADYIRSSRCLCLSVMLAIIQDHMSRSMGRIIIHPVGCYSVAGASVASPLPEATRSRPDFFDKSEVHQGTLPTGIRKFDGSRFRSTFTTRILLRSLQ